jgi:hypothetical protein
MKRTGKYVAYASILAAVIFFIQSLPLYADSMQNYCIVPPYVKRDVKPNILIMMDNATVMGDAAYCTPGTPDPSNPGQTVCTDSYVAYDPSSPHPYPGLYIPTQRYRYSSSQWVPDASGAYSGNLLNWATTSKYDLLESILVGGKSASRQQNVNVLLSVSNSWKKTLTYCDGSGSCPGSCTGSCRTCIFLVNSANVEITDLTAGSCGYLDSPTPHPVTETLTTSSNETDTRFAMDKSPGRQHGAVFPDGIITGFTKRVFGFLTLVMDFLVPDAQADNPNLRLTTSSLPSATECTQYGGTPDGITISATGGTGTGYTWSIIAGSLPSGLTMDATGTASTHIKGTPTVASGTYNFTIQVCDDAGCAVNQHRDSQAFSLIINDATVSIITSTTPATLPDGTIGSWYRSPICASGACTDSTTWMQTSGTLPPGLSLDASTQGANCYDLSGTPITAGTYNFTVQVRDSENNTASKSIFVKINPAAGTFYITTASPLAAAMDGSAYQADITTAGYSCGQCCSCGWSWSISGSLPAGLSFNTGGPCTSGDHVYITGTPTETGTFNFTVTVTAPDTCCSSPPCTAAPKAFSVTVNETAPTIRTTGNRSVKIAAGTYTCNGGGAPDCSVTACNGACNPLYCPGTCVLKSGIVDQFWPQARMGVEDFSRSAGNPGITNCIESDPGAVPDSDFLTNVENAVPSQAITKLVNGQYSAVDYYANDDSSNCDPFRNSQSCQRNFVLMISSGVGADNPPNPTAGTASIWTDATNCGSSAYKGLSKNTCFGYMNDLRNNPTLGVDNLPGRQYASTYIVNTMGTPTTEGNGRCDPTATPATDATGDILCQAASVGGGSYYEVTDPATLKQALVQAFQDIIKRAAAGTAASVLASGEGSGANLIQAVFYPRTQKIQAGGIFDTEIAWIGRLSNFWFYVDPFFNSSSIYEDTIQPDGTNNTPGIFDLSDDNRVTFFYDITNERTKAHVYPPTGSPFDIAFEKLDSLWEAGLKLWQRDLTSYPRTIYIPSAVTGATVASKLDSFTTTSNASAIMPYLNLSTTDTKGSGFGDGDLNHDGSVDSADASVLVDYVKGMDFPLYTWMRSRTVGVDLNGDRKTLQPDGTYETGEEPKVWKLGDVLNSTPRISSWIALNNYDQIYKDSSYTAYINSSGYTNRGVVFAGGNDGMLHAFKLGRLTYTWTGQTSTQKAKLIDPSSGTVCAPTDPTSCGAEMWAFIPQSVLPYLKYLAEPGYCHVYSIDLSPYIFDASIGVPGSGDISGSTRPSDGSTWRTILIGGMRFGGATKPVDSNCATNTPDGVCAPASGKGYSSYFALDVTDQANPKLLWEFSDQYLGFATTGPAIVRVGDKANNGKWFVVLGSGPTGPISTSDQQFLGHSDQSLKLFVLDLKTGIPARETIDTGIGNAFAGSMLNATSDVDPNGTGQYQDDLVYVGYVKEATDGTWTNGGVIRLQTKENEDPSTWGWSTLIDNVGPVTSSATRLINKNKGQLWVFFGTGRYYYEQTSSVDDADGLRNLYGLQDPCYTLSGLNHDCTAPFSSTITDVTSTPNANPDTIGQGWVIDLEGSGSYTYPEGSPPADVTRTYRAERVITDPLTTSSGLVFFTSYKPYNDVCAYGGKSFIWAVRYNTGGAPGALLKGIALLQVSTGSIEQVNLSSAFTQEGGRRTSALEGVPPVQQGLSLLSTPPPVKRTIHMRER